MDASGNDVANRTVSRERWVGFSPPNILKQNPYRGVPRNEEGDPNRGDYMRIRVLVMCCFLVLTGIGLAQSPGVRARLHVLTENSEWQIFLAKWVRPEGWRLPGCEWVSPTEWLWPSFGIDEVSYMVGKPVRCAYRSNTITGGCEIGEPGKVLGVEGVPDGGYFIVVHWDNQERDKLSYYGRYSRRLFVTE